MCEYCDDYHAPTELIREPIDLGVAGDWYMMIDVEDGELKFSWRDAEYSRKINYCPMCGRKLDEE